MSSNLKPGSRAWALAFDLVGDRWTLWIIAALDPAGSRFTDLAATPGLSRRVLAERLVQLTEEGVIVRERYQVRPERFRYRLTPRGERLQRIVVELVHVAAGLVPPDEALTAARVRDEALRGPQSSSLPGDAAVRELTTDARPPASPTGGDVDRPASELHPSDRLLEADPATAATIYRETVASVVRYDEQYRTQLTQTLEAYLEADASVSVTAARLYAHRHTIRYRLGRVRELTGLDVDSNADRERLALGLRAMRMFARRGQLD